MVLRTDGRKAHCSAPYRHGFLYTYFKQAQKHVTCNEQASDRVHFKQKIETGFPHGSSGRLSRSNYSNLINSSDDIQHRQQVRGSSFFLWTSIRNIYTAVCLSLYCVWSTVSTFYTFHTTMESKRRQTMRAESCACRLMCLKDRIALTPHIDLTSLMKYPERLLKRKTTGFLQSLAHKSN